MIKIKKTQNKLLQMKKIPKPKLKLNPKITKKFNKPKKNKIITPLINQQISKQKHQKEKPKAFLQN